MDDDELECRHGMEPTSCTLCNGRDKRERAEAERNARTPDGPVFIAAYEGTCPICHDVFVIGTDRIVRTKAERYIHNRCAVREA